MGRTLRREQLWSDGMTRWGDISPPPSTAKAQRVISERGHWNCCDVWIQVPAARDFTQDWKDIALTIWGINGEIRTIFERKEMLDQEGVLIPQTGNPAHYVDNLLSVRGRSCDGFEVSLELLDSGSNPTGKAKFRMEMWGDSSQNPNDRQGRTIVDPFAGRHQEVVFAGALAIGTTVVIPNSTSRYLQDRRSYVTHLDVTTDDAANHTITLLTRSAPLPLGTKGIWMMSNVAPIYATFPFPNRGLPAGDWEVALSGQTVGTFHYCVCHGFRE